MSSNAAGAASGVNKVIAGVVLGVGLTHIVANITRSLAPTSCADVTVAQQSTIAMLQEQLKKREAQASQQLEALLEKMKQCTN